MTGNELVAFARGKIGTPYVYGMKGKVLTQKTYDRLRILFGSLVWESDAAKIGQVCVDCSGLISWGTGILRNSQGYHDTADAVFPIATIGQAPIGAAVWRKGHIGIYIGGGIIPRLRERFFVSGFRKRFEDKGRFSDYLAEIPVFVITDTYAAFGGVSLLLDNYLKRNLVS